MRLDEEEKRIIKRLLINELEYLKEDYGENDPDTKEIEKLLKKFEK